MKNKILSGCAILLAAFSFHIFACTPTPSVPEDTSANFCAIFPPSVASCAPIKPVNGQSQQQYMTKIYNLMTWTYGSIVAACNKNAGANGSTVAACISQWNCYMKGGQNTDPAEKAGLCGGTGISCLK